MSDQENISTIEIIFRIFGDNLDIDQLTLALGVSPSASNKKGDNIAKGAIVNARTGSWSLEYRDSYKYGGVEERINDIADILSSSALDFRKISGYERAIINCIVSAEDESIECLLTPNTMKKLVDFEIEFGLTAI